MREIKLMVAFEDNSADPVDAIKYLMTVDRRQTTHAKIILSEGGHEMRKVEVVAHFTIGYEKLLQFIRDSMRWKNEIDRPIPSLDYPSRGLRQWSS